MDTVTKKKLQPEHSNWGQNTSLESQLLYCSGSLGLYVTDTAVVGPTYPDLSLSLSLKALYDVTTIRSIFGWCGAVVRLPTPEKR